MPCALSLTRAAAAPAALRLWRAELRSLTNAQTAEQMAAMTAESNSLVETQRNLMNMLQTMRPVLQDGRQLLDTFSGIFGNLGLGGSTAGAKPFPTPKGGFQLGGK